MKLFIAGFSLSLLISASIVYFNNIPLCAINPLSRCDFMTSADHKKEQARLAGLLAKAGIEGDTLEQRIQTIIKQGQSNLTSLTATVNKMESALNSQPIYDSNVALAAANQKLLMLKGKVNELKHILCSHSNMPANQSDCPM
jgi:hypothetical protein